MNDHPRPRIVDPFRTLRKSYMTICHEKVNAALLLDYFISVEHALDEARSQGERFGEWRQLSLSFIGEVILTNPSKHSARMAIKTLCDLGFIEGHADNATNRGGYARDARNRFRLCANAVRSALSNYHAGQIQPAVLVKSDQHTGSNLTTYAGQIRPQESVVDRVFDRDLESPPPRTAMTMAAAIDPTQLFEDWSGKLPTRGQVGIIVGWIEQYGEEAVKAAFHEATRHGGRELPYIAAVLANAGKPKPRAAAHDASKPEADWSNYRRVSPVEAATLLRGASRKDGSS